MKTNRFSLWTSAVLAAGTIGCWAPALFGADLPILPGELDPTFNPGAGANGVVMDVALAGDKIMIGGSFSEVDGVLRNGIARLEANGSVDPFFSPPPPANGVGWFVWSLAVQSDGNVIIGGQFSLEEGGQFAHLARLDSSGNPDPSFNPGSGPNAAVAEILLQPDGRILIGGDFYFINGVQAQFVARLNTDGTLDPTFLNNVGAPSPVRALALQPDGKLVVGGNNFVVRLNTDGTLDPAFASTNAFNHVVESIVVLSDGRMVIGGHFTAVNGIARRHLIRLLNNGQPDNSFDIGTGPNTVVTTLALQDDGKLVVGGGFTNVDGRTRHRIARLHADGRIDGTFVPTPGANDWLESVVLQSDGQIVLGGAFTNVNGITQNHVARLHGANPPPFPPVILAAPASQTVNEGMSATLQVDARAFPEPNYQWQLQGADVPGATEETLVLRNVRLSHAGDYRVEVSNNLGSTSAVARLTVVPAPTHPGAPDLSLLTELAFFNTPGAGNVFALAVQGDGNLFIGGNFQLVNGIPRNYLARLRPNGDLDETFVASPSLEGGVTVLALQEDGKVLVGGFLQPALKRLTATGTLDGTFVGPFSPTGVRALARQSDGKVLMSAYVSGLQLIRLQPNGSIDANFVGSPGPAGLVHAIAVQPDGRIVIGGEFMSVHGVPRNRIARLLPNGALDPSFDPGSGAMGGTSFIDEYGDRVDRTAVFALAIQPDGKVLIGGDFMRVDAMTRKRVARLNPNGSLDPSFDPGPGPDNTVLSLALQLNGKVLVGGNFTTSHGLTRNRVARLQSDGSLDLIFDPLGGANGSVRALTVLPDGAILMGGEFTTVNGVPRTGIARLYGGDPAGFAPTIVAGPTNATVNAGEDVTFSVLASGVPAPTYQWQLNGVDIPGATSWTLTLHNVRTADAGVFRVLIRNSFGLTPSAPATLAITPAPRHAGAVDIDFYTGLGPNDVVNTIAVQADGKILIGGAFTEFDGALRGRVARLERNGALDLNFDPGADDVVNSVVVQPDGLVVLGGAFTRVAGALASRVIRVNREGQRDPNFTLGLPTDGPVQTVSLDDENRILVGGGFTSAQASPRPGLARLNPDGSLDASFLPALRPGSTVTDIAVQPDGKILITGVLVGPTGILLGRVARITSEGALDASFSTESAVVSGFVGSVLTLALTDAGSIWIGGGFTQYRALPYNRLALLNPDGTTSPSFGFNEGADSFVQAITLAADGKPIIGGRFTAVGGRVLNRIARLQTNGLVDLTFDPGAGVTGGTLSVDEYGGWVDLTAVLAVAIEKDGRVLIGGDFTKVDGVTRPYVARLYDREVSSRIEIRARINAAGAIELLWEIGLLQQAPELDGPWSDVDGAQSPHRVAPMETQQFFRLRVN